MRINYYYKPPCGRLRRLWLLLTALLLSFNINVAAQTILSPYLIGTENYPNYKYGTILTNGVTVKYQGAGTYYDSSDWGGFNTGNFSVNNATLTPNKPYIEFTFTAYDNDDGDNDQTYANGVFVKYEGESSYTRIAQSGTGIYWFDNLYPNTQGVVTRVQMTRDGYSAEHNRMRFYPRYIDFGKKITSIRFVSYLLYNNRNGNSRPAYCVPNQQVDYMFVYDIPISYNMSYIGEKGTFTENKGGEVTFSTSYNIDAVASVDNSSSWSANKHLTLADRNVNWKSYKTTVSQVNKDGTIICSGTPTYTNNNSTNETSGTCSFVPADYNVERYYLTKHNLERTFYTGTNGWTHNIIHYVKQTLLWDEVLPTLKPIAHADKLTASTDMWKKQITLSWEPHAGDVNSDGKWYVFRYLKANGESSRGEAIKTLPYETTQYTDKDITELDSTYVYEVSFCPTAWGEIGVPEPSLTKKIEVAVVRKFDMKLGIEALEKDEVSAGIKVTWSHIPIEEQNVQFKIWCRERPKDANGNAVSDEEAADIPFKQIATVDRKNAEATSHTYTDKDAGSPCALYEYYVSTEILGKEFQSDSLYGSITGGSRVKKLTASKGTYSNVVKVLWEVQQVGATATKYNLLRRQLGGNGTFSKIYTTQGTASEYQYEDNTVFPGNYYEYKVEVYSVCDADEGSFSFNNDMTSDGFSQSTGTISGRITYGTGTAVEGVKVVLTKSSDDYNTKNQFYALESTAAGGGITYEMNSELVTTLFGKGKTATFQMWVNPLSVITDASGNHLKPAIIATESFMLYGEYVEASNSYALRFRTNSSSGVAQDINTGDTIRANNYSHITLTVTSNKLSLTVIDKEGEMVTKEVAINSFPLLGSEKTLRIGSAASESDLIPYTFKGLMDEIRVWNKVLSEKDIKNNFDRLLSGAEQGLRIYWPLDEGIIGQTTAYDYSKTDGVTNECHGTIITASTSRSTNVPSSDLLSLYGITDAEGNYIIRGIPFAGEGTNYVVTPLMGIHEFSPKYVTRYVSANSLSHSGTDMEDVSSFKVSGTVYYENTLYPVAGANLYVDGTMCSRDGEAISTDEYGNYTISVPIGDHHIQVKKQGHTFVDEGRYPVDPNSLGMKHTFDREISNLTFYDNTLVTIAGRVTGGEIEGSKPIGLGTSINTIGKARIELTTGYKMNVVESKEGTTYSYKDNPNDLAISSPTTAVHSISYRKGGNDLDVRKIIIETDPETGEFAALLPPVEYKVENITVASNTDVKFTDLSIIDATNPLVIMTDSAEVDSVMKTFDYTASMKQTYRVDPVFTVEDKGADEGAFGAKKYTLPSTDGSKTTLPLYTVSNGTVNYLYGSPIFIQNEQYTFLLKGYEEYVNRDKETPLISRIPLTGAIVTISNQLSSEQSVRGAEDATSPGEIVDLKSNQLELDENGEATYKFSVGFPNIIEDQGFSRGLNISFENNGEEVSWSGNGTFKGIILGALPTGTNFVTAGPDKIIMILRDPPGSNSKVVWSEGTSHTESSTVSGTFTSNTEVEFTHKFGVDLTTAQGSPVFSIITSQSMDYDLTWGVHVNEHIENGSSHATTITTTKSVSTSDNPDYVGADGDVFIGTGTNILFGDARTVTIVKDVNGNYNLGLVTSKITSTKFTTAFQYTQYYVKNSLLPNLCELRNAMLTQVLPSEYDNYVNKGKTAMYITKLSPDDERFGSSNYDEKVWKNEVATDTLLMAGPSYKVVLPENMDPKTFHQDSVFWYNKQIALWENKLYENERMKVKAIEDRGEYLQTNLSFDAGAIIENGSEETKVDEDFTTNETEVLGYICNEQGHDWLGTGTLIHISEEIGGGVNFTDHDTDEKTTAFVYTLAEEGSDALTIDVFNAPDKKGPIFVTRGGQTSAPYEGETLTEYYRPGTSISTATMQIEVPEITVTNPLATGVPSGQAAAFELLLTNLSDVKEDVWYDLALVDESNANGAKLSIDGAVVTSGRAILVPAGQTLKKTLLLTQTDQSVLDYEDIRIVLKSQGQGDPSSIRGAIADTVAISAHFVPSCSDITLRIDNRTINTRTGGTLALTVGDINRNYRSFRGFRIEYLYANDSKWSVARTYVMDKKDAVNGALMMPEGSPIEISLDMSNAALYPDGKYIFRAVTMCDFGSGEVNNESAEIEVVKDVTKPQILGSPNPANGVLGVGDDIYVTFNKDIRSGAIGANNIRVTAALNGAPVSHSTALLLSGSTTAAAHTEAEIRLGRHDFAADFWINAKSGGTIFEHGAARNKLNVGLRGDGFMVVNIAGTEYVSKNAVPMGKWTFVSLCYKYAEGASLLSAQAASDAETIDLFKNEDVADYTGNGRVAIGAGMDGSIHELTLWDRARMLSESQGEMYVSKSPATPNLIGYWRMDEGHGQLVRDYARNRHMTLLSGWALDNENMAAAFNGADSYAELDISAAGIRPADNYAFELWFKGEAQNNATIFSIGSDRLALRTDAEGKLALVTNGGESVLGTADYMDGKWHHFALNVLRSGSSRVYVDGASVKQYDSGIMPSMEGDAITIGAARKLVADGNTSRYERSEWFKGEVDEIRLWNATLTSDVIDANRYSRIDTARVAGLVAYYPFETRELDSNLQVVTSFTLDDQSKSGSVSKEAPGVVRAASAPGLKEAPGATNLKFAYTASERQIYITLNEDAARLEGTTVTFALSGVYDVNGNLMNDVMWTAFVARNQLKWSEESVAVERAQDDAAESFSVSIENMGGSDEQWTLSGVPAWLKVSDTNGSLRPLSSKDVTFTVGDDVAIGKYEETVYLTGNNGISVPLVVSLKVTGRKPQWSVNAADFELSMNMVGQLQVDGIVTDDADDVLGAFVGDMCVGLASPVYYPRYDGYYVHLTVFGNEEELSEPVTFRMWDASTGDIYTKVATTAEMAFISNKLTGSMGTPFVWNAKEEREQTMALVKGWNWTSLYVVPEEGKSSLDDMFNKNVENFSIIKNVDKFSTPVDGSWMGTVGSVAVGKLYKVQTTEAVDMSVYGKTLVAAQHPVTVSRGWNWIGFNSGSRMMVDDALAGLAPQTGDVLKGQRNFSVYEDYQWVGTLVALVPGQGYMYQSMAAEDKSFTYPAAHPAKGRAESKTRGGEENLDPVVFAPVAASLYPGTMTMIARVEQNGEVKTDVEVGAFVGDECRGAIKAMESGLVFLSVFGETPNERVILKVSLDGEIYTVDQNLYFIEDAMHGKVKEPYIIDLDEVATGINSIDLDGETKVYSLQGIYLGNSLTGLNDGVYIVNGKKMTVRNGKVMTLQK